MLWSSSHKNEILSSAKNEEKKRIFSYNHLVLLALAVLLAFQAIERMCGPFGWIFMPHRWDFSNIHNKEILMQRIWTILNSFWLLHILMKLGSLIKWMGMLPANTEFLKRKKEKLADLNLRFILQHLLLSESWTLKYCWELKRTVKVTTEFYWKNLYGIEHGRFFLWCLERFNRWNLKGRSFCLVANGSFRKFTLVALDLRDLVAFLRLRKLAWDSFP